MMAAKKAELVRCQEDLESSREKYDVLQRELGIDRGSFRIYSRNRAPWSLDMRR